MLDIPINASIGIRIAIWYFGQSTRKTNPRLKCEPHGWELPNPEVHGQVRGGFGKIHRLLNVAG